MKVRDPELVRDVEELLEESVFQEAANAVWLIFQKSLEALEPESRELLELHFDGRSPKEISERLDLSEEQVKKWLTKAKRDVIKGIGKDTKVRQ